MSNMKIAALVAILVTCTAAANSPGSGLAMPAVLGPHANSSSATMVKSRWP